MDSPENKDYQFKASLVDSPRGIKKEIEHYYVYVLLSEKDNNFYTGYTSNLEKRIMQHNNGEVMSTKHRRPLKLIYFEGCLHQQDATKREKHLKSGFGKRYLNKRLSNFLIQRGKWPDHDPA